MPERDQIDREPAVRIKDSAAMVAPIQMDFDAAPLIGRERIIEPVVEPGLYLIARQCLTLYRFSNCRILRS
ncbi:MAG TPA: hypothetical protein VNT79_10530 [Phycisphaerae bacterium]|nr:hypothetical protein [Phycisphaerae bacterium]